MSNPVIILKDVAAFDVNAYTRPVIGTSNILNGATFKLDTKNATEKSAWTPSALTALTANMRGVWMATGAEHIYTDKEHGGSGDPRDYVNVAGRAFDATFLIPGDQIEVYGLTSQGATSYDYITISTALNGASGAMNLVAATAAPSTGVYFAKVDADTVHIGDGTLAPAALNSYIYEVRVNG